MSHHLTRPLVLATIAVAALAAWPLAASAQSIPLKRVMLSTGGVGYFEHEAVVEGDAQLDLVVRLDQVDDVLKSVVVYDDRGGVGSVSLPGREPLHQIFRDLPFGPEALTSPVALLNSLQGEAIEVVGARTVSGRLVRVVPETLQLPDGGGVITRNRVSVLTGSGLQQFILEETQSVRFTAPGLQDQVERALAAISTHRVRDKRTLKVNLQGDARRTVRAAYVVEAPLWKASYRLTLDDNDKANEGLLHGWAVIENMSGQDWRDVELTLLSGNPVTFRQALYTAYYVPRPTVPVEVLGRLLPRPDTGAVTTGARGGQAGNEDEKLLDEMRKRAELGQSKSQLRDREAMERPMAAKPASPEMAGAAAEPSADSIVGGGVLANLAQAAVSEEAATQVVFRLPDKVSVESGHSLMVPIVDRRVPARRVALYQPDTHPLHPLASVRLTNDGESGLPPGVLTLYERAASGAVAYVGDARLTTLPAGEERLVSYALDQKTRIDREVKHGRSVIKSAIERGVMRLTVARRQSTSYKVKGPAREDRVVLIEVPRQAGWKLIEPDEKTIELTESHYRIERPVAAGETVEFDVALELPVVERVQIASLNAAQVGAYAASGELDPAVRQAFERIAELQREVARHSDDLAKLEEQRKKIFQEQSRIRDNMNRVPRESDIYRRYLDKLDAQEDEIEAIAENRARTSDRLAEAQRALADFIAELKV